MGGSFGRKSTSLANIIVGSKVDSRSTRRERLHMLARGRFVLSTTDNRMVTDPRLKSTPPGRQRRRLGLALRVDSRGLSKLGDTKHRRSD